MQELYAEVITIGDEILYGQITDTNTQWLSAELSLLGIKTIRKSSVGDRFDEIVNILRESSQRAKLVILTGGLGPTNDDITKKALAGYLQQPLEINDDVLKDVSDFFISRGKTLTAVNRDQALVPVGSIALRNHNGTAPGMWVEKDQTVFISLPGVPYEMKGIMTDYGFTLIKKHFTTPYILHKIIRTAGIGESMLAERIQAWEQQLPSALSLAYLPSYGGVKLRLTGTGENRSSLESMVSHEIKQLIPLIGPAYFYAEEDFNLEQYIGQLLKTSGQTIALAESCTGGYIQHLITSVPGCSAYFKGGIVTYSNDMKEKELGVPAEVLQKHGAVSEETARAMASGILNKFDTSFALSVTGIAGPDGGTPEKPVGMVCMAFAAKSGLLFSKTFQFGKQRDTNIKVAASAALNLLRLGIEGKLS